MILSAQDFEDAVSYVENSNDVFNKKISSQMSSSQFNSIFEELETQINNLYEKTRLLEDIKNYTKSFVVSVIEERRRKIISNLKVIEERVDSFEDNESVAVALDFETLETVYDRDGKQLSLLESDESFLVMPGTTIAQETPRYVINNGQIQSIIDDSGKEKVVAMAGAEPFAELTLGTFNNSPLRSVYEADTPIEGGLRVQYTASFEGLQKYNYIKIRPVNCKVEDISLTTSDYDIVPVKATTVYLKDPIRLLNANISVVCNNYDRKQQNMLSSASQNDAFNKILTGDIVYGQEYLER